MPSKFGLLGLVFCGVLSAQSAPLSGPIEAFAFDAPTRTLRAVNGSLGSASLGPPLFSEIEFGSVAPHKDYAVAFRRGRGLIISSLGSDQPSSTLLADSASVPEGVPEGVGWSGDGSSAILYSRAGNWIQKLTGMPASPKLGPSLSLSLLGGSLSALAIDTTGAHIAIGVTGGASAGIFDMTDGQGFVPLLSLSQPIALSFSDDGGTLYGIDGSTHQLSELKMADLTSRMWGLDPLQDPVAVRSVKGAGNSQAIYVAGRNDRLLMALDVSSHQTISIIPLSFQPTSLDPLGRNSFVLNSRDGHDPLWSLVTSPQASVYFVPATPLALRQGEVALQLQEDRRK
jgi:hypothetical protein